MFVTCTTKFTQNFIVQCVNFIVVQGVNFIVQCVNFIVHTTNTVEAWERVIRHSGIRHFDIRHSGNNSWEQG